MLVTCVRTGDKYSEDYVWKLKWMVNRHLPGSHDFICITDKPIQGIWCIEATLPTWWAKLQNFQMRKPLIAFDLDTVIVDDLSPLLAWEGFGIIRDFNEWRCSYSAQNPDEKIILTPVFNSGIMVLTGNEGHVWDEFTPAVMDRFPRGGDQRWITRCMPDAKTFPPEWFASWKLGNCEDGPPPGALAICMHGWPKPHELMDTWISDYWQ